MQDEIDISEYRPQEVITFHPNTQIDGDISFYVHDKTVLKLCGNGDIYVNGNLAENDKLVVDALRKFLRGSGFDC